MRRARVLLVGLLWLCAAGCATSAPQRATPRPATEEEKRALAGLLGRKLRTALTAFAVVLGVAMVSGTLVLTDSIDKAFNFIYTNYNCGDV